MEAKTAKDAKETQDTIETMDAKETLVITRKITLYPRGDKTEVNRVYNYIRNGQEIQAWMMNRCISAMYIARQNNATNEELREISRSYSQLPKDKNPNSAYHDMDMSKFPKGITIPGCIPRMVQAKLDTAYKDGLKYGKVSLPTFRSSLPLHVQRPLLNPINDPRRVASSTLGLNHGYESINKLLIALEEDDKPDVFIKFANNIIFDIVFGKPNSSEELRSLFTKIFRLEYQVCDSAIAVVNNKIQLYLSLKIPKKKHDLDEDTVVGVHLGMAVPAVCALNNNLYTREYIGDYQEFIAWRAKKKKMRSRIQSNLQDAKGGHGRNRKLQALDKFEKYIKNYSTLYNHKISKRVIEFALKNNAAWINMPDLAGLKDIVITEENGEETREHFLLEEWSLYQLQSDILYKADKEGIKVRFVKAADTAKTCSVCGQKTIKRGVKTCSCTNPDCKIKKIYNKPGNSMASHFADFNAARNIALSEDYVERGESSSKSKAGKKKLKEAAEAKKAVAKGKADTEKSNVAAETIKTSAKKKTTTKKKAAKKED